MRIVALLALVLASLVGAQLSGCAAAGDPAVVAGSLSAARTTLQMWLEAGAPNLLDEDLQGRRKIMGYVVPGTSEIATLAISYKSALDAEAAKRNLPGVKSMKLSARGERLRLWMTCQLPDGEMP